MQSQVEALSLAHSPLRRANMEAKQGRIVSELLPHRWEIRGSLKQHPQLIKGITSDGVGFYTSNKWIKFYPNQEVAVVTSIGQPSIPPEGYIPLRRGHCRAHHTPEVAMVYEEDVPKGFSVDTLLWDEKLLEQRIMQLTAWTRRSPMPRRQKLDRINRMVKQCTFNSVNTKI